MDNYINSFKNVILYKNEFYIDNFPEFIFLHNRNDIRYYFKDKKNLDENVFKNITVYNKTLLFIEGFHNNPGHLLWDFIYPSWYSLYFINKENYDISFQWITNNDMYIKYGDGWDKNICEKISGNKILTPNILSDSYTTPLMIPLLISGIKNIGINCVNKKICANLSFCKDINQKDDSVDIFINFVYKKFNIIRNNYIINSEKIKNIIYIHNKRPYNGINQLFQKLARKYDKYNFLYIDWGNYSFEEQLKILNNTCIIICGVGTARANTPFLPNGSIEIQTNHHSKILPNNIDFFDCHLGTISNNIKVININKYSQIEVNNNLLSNDIEKYIEENINNLPISYPINIENNIPDFIKNNILPKITEKNFKLWRNSNSNNITDLYNIIKNSFDTLPIIIFHLGDREYVHLCLKQAKKYNNDVILLTDVPDVYKHTGATCVDFQKYANRINEFQKIYKHFSTNSYQLELICIIRWFVIYDYMKEFNIPRAFICDSDVLIYDNIANIDEKYLKSYDFMLCSSHSKDVTGGQSIWSFSNLQNFVIFCFKFYKEQLPNIEKWHKSYRAPGGICDMTLLYYYAHNQSIFQGLQLPTFPTIDNDLTQIFDDELTFDLHLATHGNHLYPEDYETDNINNKKIKYINNQPYCFNKRLNKDIRFILLHFQGRNKTVMKDYYLKTNL